MPMGIVTDKDFESESGKLNTPSVPSRPVKTEILDRERGRKEGDTNVPDSLRKLIGMESVESGRDSALQLAASLGISPSSVSAYSVGATSTASYNEKPNGSIIKDAKTRVSNKARRVLLRAMHNITDDKLESAKATELAGVAKDMSAIIRNMDDKTPPTANGPSGPGAPTFVFYSPEFRQENHYETIVVKE